MPTTKVTLELDTKAVKALLESRASKTRKVPAAKLRTLRQINASDLLTKQQLGQVIGIIAKFKQYPDIAPELIDRFTPMLVDTSKLLNPLKQTALFHAGPNTPMLVSRGGKPNVG